MNENINLCEILKDCPKGTELYSPLVGVVILQYIIEVETYQIVTCTPDGLDKYEFTKEGKYYDNKDGECVLFPSKDQRDWSKWQCPKPKFDPKTLKPFDKVLCRQNTTNWQCNMFSYIEDDWKEVTYPFHCFSSVFRYTIPYNDDTKHLVGTMDEAPEYYRYWED